MNAEQTGPVLVLGGTGKTGRRIVSRLAARGLPVRVGSRSGSPAFRWDDPAGWPVLLSGVDAAYIAYAPDLAVPGAVEDVRSFAEMAAAQGVRRLVLLSGRGEPEAEEAERALAAAATAGGADWTVLRASWFAQNFSESFLLDGVLAGEIALPASEIPEPFVDADDIADVAVAALTGTGHAGRIYELTGARALTFAAAVAEIGRASGRDLRYGTMPAPEFGEMLRSFQVPEAEVQLILYLFGTVLDGRNAAPADGIRQALGRAPRDFADYARAAAAAGAWSVTTKAAGSNAA